MFVGAIPKPMVEQVVELLPLEQWGGRVWIGCSGSFRFESALAQRFPGARVVSNDVSLLSSAIGFLAVERPLAMRFTGRLDWLEELLEDAAPIRRVAGIVLALELARFKGANEYAQAHFAHYRANADGYLDTAEGKLSKILAGLRIEDFFCGDFREQADRAREQGGGVVAFPPTYKGIYERNYRFVDENTEW